MHFVFDNILIENEDVKYYLQRFIEEKKRYKKKENIAKFFSLFMFCFIIQRSNCLIYKSFFYAFILNYDIYSYNSNFFLFLNSFCDIFVYRSNYDINLYYVIQEECSYI